MELLSREVAIVDCCLPVADMRQIAAEARKVLWLDHHETALAVRADLGWGVIDTAECGASLCWRVLFPDQPLPDILAYIRDKDLWRWELPHSRAIAAALEERMDEDHLDELWTWDLQELRERGRTLLTGITKEVQRILKHGVRSRDPFGLMGKQALVLCNSRHTNESAEAAYAPTDGTPAVDIVIQIHLRSDGKWVHSLRAPVIDCRLLAEARGGGGHPRAAAYLAKEPFPQSADCLDWPG